MRSLLENHTYDLVKLLQEKKALRNKLVYRLKTKNNGSQLRYKAEPVVKGFNQKKGIVSRPESRPDLIGGSEPVSETRDSGLGLFT